MNSNLWRKSGRLAVLLVLSTAAALMVSTLIGVWLAESMALGL